MLYDDNAFEFFFSLRELGIHFFERLAKDLTDDQIPIPFAVRRNDMPRREIRVATCQRGFIGPLIIVPQLSFIQVPLVELPEFVRIIQACLETLALFFVASVTGLPQGQMAMVSGV